jgi:hypothetical protein
MNMETLNTIAQFLNRVELRGNEVPAFTSAMEALSALAQEMQQQQPAESFPSVEESE